MFDSTIALIKPLDVEAMDKCQVRLDNLTKPLDSLHAFEYLARKIAGVTRNPRPRVVKRSIILAAAMQELYTIAPVNIFAEHVSADIVSMNIDSCIEITQEEVIKVMQMGIKTADKEIRKGSQLIGIGALVADSTIQRVASAIEDFDFDTELPLTILCYLNVMEIAALVGVILGAAAGGAAVVLDGLVTSVAALIAVKISPGVKDYLIGSHFSIEPAHKLVIEKIGVPAYLHLDIAICDGTGAALGMSLIDASLHVINDMKTFGEAEVAVAQDGPGALKQNKDIRD